MHANFQVLYSKLFASTRDLSNPIKNNLAVLNCSLLEVKHLIKILLDSLTITEINVWGNFSFKTNQCLLLPHILPQLEKNQWYHQVISQTVQWVGLNAKAPQELHVHYFHSKIDSVAYLHNHLTKKELNQKISNVYGFLACMSLSLW